MVERRPFGPTITEPAGGSLGRVAVVAGVVVAVTAGCASSPPVPQWRDPEPSVAAPAVSDAPAVPLDAPAVGSSRMPGAEPGSPPASASPEPEPAVDGPASDERFLAAVRGELAGATVDLRNEEIAEMGGQACASLAAGLPRRAVAAELTGYGLAEAELRRLVTLARSTLCDG
jgi:hypothetical protein